MVSADYDPQTRTGRIVLQPNRSWNWRANVVFVAGMAAISLTIGIGFLFQGYWLVLPFGVLETGFLAACLYLCVRGTHVQEVLTFSDDELRIERGIRRPDQHHVFKRLFARIFVRPARHQWYAPRIAVRSHGREVEIGAFLTHDDKRALIDHLRRIVDALETA